MLGILLAEYGGWQVWLLAAMLAMAVLLPQCVKRNYRECVLRGALLIAAGALGVGCYVRQTDSREKEEQALLCGQQLQVCGTLIRKEQKNERWQLTLALPGYENRVVVSTEDGGYPLEAVLSVKGPVREFSSPRNEGQFNEKQYYKNRKIIGRMSAEEIRCIRVPVGMHAWKEMLYRLRTRLCEVYGSCLSQQAAGILSTMAVGEKAFLDGNVRTLFQRSGISHMLAISGMHISMVGMAVYTFFRKCRRSYVCGAFLTTGALLLYGTMIGMGVSASRAIGMFLIYLLAQCLGRGYDTCAALAVLAVLLLVDNPFLLHDAGFQFSFLAVFAAVTAGMVLPKAEEGGRFYRLVHPFLVALLLQLFTLPLVAYYYYELPVYALFLNLLLLPYLGAALGFGLIGGCVGMRWLPVGRLVLMPCQIVLSVYMWVCEMVQKMPFSTVICGQPQAAKLWLYYGLLVGLLFVLEHEKKRRQACTGEETESCGTKKGEGNRLKVHAGRKKNVFWGFFACERRQASEKNGAGTATGEIHERDRTAERTRTAERKKMAGMEGIRGIYGSVLIGTLVLLILLMYVPAVGFEIDYLDVGQGDASMLRTEEGEVCFVDGGSSDVSGVGTYRILPFLKSKGIRKVDYWILSHLDEDHVNGFYEVLKSGYQIDAVIISELMPEDEAKEQLMGTLEQYDVSVIAVRSGDMIQLKNTGSTDAVCDKMTLSEGSADVKDFSGATLYFLAPDVATPISDCNGASLVCLYEDAYVRALWTGDIGEKQEEWLLAGGKLPEVDLYKAAHHGSKYSNSAEYLKALSPKLSVISCGVNNRYGHPGAEAIEHIESAGSQILYTMESGQIRVGWATSEKFINRYEIPVCAKRKLLISTK